MPTENKSKNNQVMTSNLSMFPSEPEWLEMVKSHLVPELTPPVADSAVRNAPVLEGLAPMALPMLLQDWMMQLANRMFQARRSYLLMMFYKERGINDDEYFVSPGTGGSSLEYFAHFTDDDHLNQTMFGDAADTFFFKLFGCFDTVAWLIKEAYGLKTKKPDFKNVLADKAFQKTSLGKQLAAVATSADFLKASQMRNDITHNFRPTTVGATIKPLEKSEMPPEFEGEPTLAHGFSVGVGGYVGTDEVIKVAHAGIARLKEALDLTFVAQEPGVA